MAAAGGLAPSSWQQWKEPNSNRNPPSFKKLRLEYRAAEEAPLPPGVNPRESKVYQLTNENMTGNRDIDESTKALTKEYNNVAFNRREIIRALIHMKKTCKSKSLPKEIKKDIKALVYATKALRKGYKDVKKNGGKPIPFPDIFDTPVDAPDPRPQ